MSVNEALKAELVRLVQDLPPPDNPQRNILGLLWQTTPTVRTKAVSDTWWVVIRPRKKSIVDWTAQPHTLGDGFAVVKSGKAAIIYCHRRLLQEVEAICAVA